MRPRPAEYPPDGPHMPVKITTKGYIELWRGEAKVSQHTAESDAFERAMADAEASGGFLYLLKFPTKEIDLSRLRRVIRDTDVTRPTTPVGLAAVPVSETAINLSWAPSTDPVGAPTEAQSGVAGYKIYRDGVLRNTQSGTTFPDAGLTAGTLYSYRLTAYDNAGNESVLSAPVTARTLQAPVWASDGLQALIQNVAYSLNLDTLCTDPEGQPLTYTIVSGTLPAGLTQSGTRGQIISGTPTAAVTSNVTVRASD